VNDFPVPVLADKARESTNTLHARGSGEPVPLKQTLAAGETFGRETIGGEWPSGFTANAVTRPFSDPRMCAWCQTPYNGHPAKVVERHDSFIFIPAVIEG
jgi:hypothetical protein